MNFFYPALLLLVACAGNPDTKPDARWLTQEELDYVFPGDRLNDVAALLEGEAKGLTYREQACEKAGAKSCTVIACDRRDGTTDCWWEEADSAVRQKLNEDITKAPTTKAASSDSADQKGSDALLKLFFDETDTDPGKSSSTRIFSNKGQLPKDVKSCEKAETDLEVNACISLYFKQSGKKAEATLKKICGRKEVFCLLDGKQRVGELKVRPQAAGTKIQYSVREADGEQTKEHSLLYLRK